MVQRQPARRTTQSSASPVSIPDKLYFRIGDVSRLCNLPTYVLRFWESEFPQLKPSKGGTGQRLYRKRDVEIVLNIKRLLYDEGFTIAGARRLLTEKRRSASEAPSFSAQEQPSRDGAAPQRESSPTVKSPQGSGRRTSPGASPRSGIPELREEMRSLLALLKSSPQDAGAVAAPVRRNQKKDRSESKAHPDEPTLF